MAAIFISHSSRNNDQALKLRDWLLTQGWGRDQIFLDLDNLQSGQRWRDQLNQFGTVCEAVIVCLSDEWLSSLECVREFNYAESLGKPVFPIIVAPVTQPIPRYISDIQMADISAPHSASDGFNKLRAGLFAARISPDHFPWPPPDEKGRAPYRGLSVFEEKDAAIYFGRDGAISKGLDAIRVLRDRAASGGPRMLVILGASGAGKSSFLRAGLLPRLKRDAVRFTVLAPIRPERRALSGPQGLEKALGLSAHASANEIRARFDELRQASPAAVATRESGHPQTIIIPFDQAEELYAAENTESRGAVDFLCRIIDADPDVLVLVTIRSDCFLDVQNDERLAAISREPFDLPPVTAAAFKEVITGPGQLGDPPVVFESELVDRLVNDLGGRDSLPLLSFTLERLFTKFAGAGKITLSHYLEELGGVAGAIDAAVEAAFAAARNDPGLPSDRVSLEAIARTAFIPGLATIEEVDSEPKRAPVRADDLSSDAARLLEHFVQQRLVSSYALDGVRIFEVCHEAVLRHWRLFRDWVEIDREALIGLERLRRAANVYDGSRLEDDLVHRGDALIKIEAVAARPDFQAILREVDRAYVSACRAHADAEAAAQKRGRLLSRILPVTAAAALAAITGVYIAVTQLANGFSEWRATSLMPDAIRAAEFGRNDLAMRLALAATPPPGSIAPVEDDALAMLELSTAVAASRGGAAGKRIYKSAAFDPRIEYVFVGDNAGDITRLSLRGPDPFANFRISAGEEISALGVSPSGGWLAAATRVGEVKIWKLPADPYAVFTGAAPDCVASVGDMVVGAFDFEPGGAQLIAVGGANGARTGSAAIIDLPSCAAEITALGDQSAWPIAASWRTAHQVDIVDARWATHQFTFASEGLSFSGDAGADAALTAACAALECDHSVRPLLSRAGNVVAFRSAGAIFIYDQAGATTRSAPDPCAAREGGPRAQLRMAGDAALTKLLLVCDDGRAFAWRPPQAPVALDASATQSVLSDDGAVQASIDLDGVLSIVGRDGARDTISLAREIEGGVVTAMAVNGATGRAALVIKPAGASSGAAAQIFVVDIAERLTKKIAERPADVTRLRFDRAGAKLLASGWDEKVCIYDIANDGALCFGDQGATGTDAIWSADEAAIATIGNKSAGPTLWDARSGGLMAAGERTEGQSTLWFVAASPVDGALATGGERGVVSIWAVTQNETPKISREAVLYGHRGTVQDAAFSPSGRRLVTISADNTVRLWNIDAARNIATAIFPAKSAAWSAAGLILLGNEGAAVFMDDRAAASAVRRMACDTLQGEAKLFDFSEIDQNRALRATDCAPCEAAGALSIKYWARRLAGDNKGLCRKG